MGGYEILPLMIIARTSASSLRLSSLDSYSEQAVNVENFLTNGYYAKPTVGSSRSYCVSHCAVLIDLR
jgi:hypothetical protein